GEHAIDLHAFPGKGAEGGRDGYRQDARAFAEAAGGDVFAQHAHHGRLRLDEDRVARSARERLDAERAASREAVGNRRAAQPPSRSELLKQPPPPRAGLGSDPAPAGNTQLAPVPPAGDDSDRHGPTELLVV